MNLKAMTASTASPAVISPATEDAPEDRKCTVQECKVTTKISATLAASKEKILKMSKTLSVGVTCKSPSFNLETGENVAAVKSRVFRDIPKKSFNSSEIKIPQGKL